MTQPFIQTRSGSRYDALTLAVFGLLLANSILQGAFGAMLPFIGSDLPMTHTVESLHITAMAAGGLVFSLLSEPIRRRFGRKASLITAAACSASGAMGLALAVAPIMSILSMVLVGAGMSGVLIIGQSLLVGLHGTYAPRMIGEFNIVYSVGAAIAAVVFPLIAISVLGWRGYSGIQVAIILLIAIPFIVRGARNANSTASPQTVIGPRLRRPALAVAVMPLAVVVEWTFLFWTATYLLDVAHIAKDAAAMAVSALWITVVFGRAIGSRAMPRFGAHRVLTASLVMAIGAFISLNMVNTAFQAAVAAALAGLGAANLYPASIALVVSSDPTKADQAVTRASFLTACATIVSPLAFGALADAVGLETAFYVVPTIAIITITMIWVVGPRRLASTVLLPRSCA